MNLTGPETISTRWIAERFGLHFGCEPIYTGDEASSAFISNAAKQHRLFGYPKVTPEEMIEWIADWIVTGGRMLGKPTGFQTRNGKF
jgi:hypothetical protein